MKQVQLNIAAPKLYPIWSDERPLWWICYRTKTPGTFAEVDAVEFNACKAKYLIFFDHSLHDKAQELAIFFLTRYSFFKAAKVSKYARDGEKSLVLLGRDDRCKDSVADIAKQWGMLLYIVKDAKDPSDHEKQANALWGTYLHRLARAFGSR